MRPFKRAFASIVTINTVLMLMLITININGHGHDSHYQHCLARRFKWSHGFGSDGLHRLIRIGTFWRLGKEGKITTITLKASEWRSHIQLFAAFLQADDELISNADHLQVRLIRAKFQ